MKRVAAPQHPEAAREAALRMEREKARSRKAPRTNDERDRLLDLLLERTAQDG